MFLAKLCFRALIAGVAVFSITGVAFADSTVPIFIKPDAKTEVPQRFLDGPVRIAVVRRLHVYQEWMVGVTTGADKLGIELTIYSAYGDYRRRATSTQQDVIVLSWEGSDSPREASIPVTTYYAQAEPPDSTTGRQEHRGGLRFLSCRDDAGGGQEPMDGHARLNSVA